jgi:hypothetical protein
MVLCQTLVDADIPRWDKMREAVINKWRVSFEKLKSDLSVHIGIFFLIPLINFTSSVIEILWAD